MEAYKVMILILGFTLIFICISGCIEKPGGGGTIDTTVTTTPTVKCFDKEIIQDYLGKGNCLVIVEESVYNMTGSVEEDKCGNFYLKGEIDLEPGNKIGELCTENLKKVRYDAKIGISPDLREFVSKLINDTTRELKEICKITPTEDYGGWELITDVRVINMNTDVRDFCEFDIVISSENATLNLVKNCEISTYVAGEGDSRIYIAKNKKENRFIEYLLLELNEIEGYERIQRYEL